MFYCHFPPGYNNPYMQRALTRVLIVLILILLWMLGYIQEYEQPCRKFCRTVQVEASEPVVVESPALDLRILCQAIAVAETSNCTKGSALSHNNCHGITLRKGGYRTFSTFAESFAACEDLWSRKYVHFPDMALAAKWSSPGAAETWLGNVTRAYESRL